MFRSVASCRSERRLEGCRAVITGASGGIGLETARELHRRGASLILAVRDVERGARAAADIQASSADREKGTASSLEVLQLDLSSLESVRRFAGEVLQRWGEIQLLVNNAGVMACPRAETTDGFELQMGTNHLGHFLLTSLLLDALTHGAPSRIINVSSRAHFRGKIDFDDLMSKESYSAWGSYSQSKLANVLFTEELARRLQGSGVTCHSLHPGLVRTDLWRHMTRPLSWVLQAVAVLFWLTPVQGAQTTLHCALQDGESLKNGGYYENCSLATPLIWDGRDGDAKKLWELSEKYVGLHNQCAE